MKGILGVAIWLGGLHLNILLFLIEIYWGIYRGHPYGLSAIGLHLTLCFFPALSEYTPAWVTIPLGIIVRWIQNYFPVSMEVSEVTFNGVPINCSFGDDLRTR
eukprot:4653503-Pyramimonas_sp.AAC.1